MNHPSARQVIVEAFRLEKGRAPIAWEAQVVQTLAWLETNYGAGWQKPVADGIADPEALTSNNWGAVQYGPPPPTPGKSFGTRDTHRDGTPYTYTYRIYPSPVEGARDIVRILEKRKVLGLARNAACTSWVIAQNIIRSGYSEGYSKTGDEAEAIRNYWARWKACVRTVAAGVGERAMPEGGGGEAPTFFREPGPAKSTESPTDPGPQAGSDRSDLDLAALTAAFRELHAAQTELGEAVRQVTAKLDVTIARVEAAVVDALDIVNRQVTNTTRLDQLSTDVESLKHRVAILESSRPPKAAE